MGKLRHSPSNRLCECGCGRMTAILSVPTRERAAGVPARFVPGHNTRKPGSYGRTFWRTA